MPWTTKYTEVLNLTLDYNGLHASRACGFDVVLFHVPLNYEFLTVSSFVLELTLLFYMLLYKAVQT